MAFAPLLGVNSITKNIAKNLTEVIQDIRELTWVYLSTQNFKTLIETKELKPSQYCQCLYPVSFKDVSDLASSQILVTHASKLNLTLLHDSL